MTNKTKEQLLYEKVQQQEKQIDTLKQAILRLERKLQSVSTIANRANGQSRRITEQVRTIQHKIGKG